MCGIAGIIALQSAKVKFEAIVDMTDALRHRGPDGEGFLITNGGDFTRALRQKRPMAIVTEPSHSQLVALGHRRLSIVDLSAAAGQPMTDESGRFSIVFNGEIYNHHELRRALVQLGCKFNTDHSDTEVVLAAYSRWGTSCLEKFNGMWAFCIWDQVENTFFMARDRVGKKPFYYTLFDGAFYFASELKALLVVKEIPRTLDERAMYDYLTYMMVPAPRTAFKDIYKLQAAHYIIYKPGEEIKTKQYWSPFTQAGYLESSENKIAEVLREKLRQAAKIRYVADVEVGALLSGGVDSSINLACLSDGGTKPVKAFSVGFENSNGYENEFRFARLVAEKFNADYNELTLTESDFVKFLPEMIYYQDEPIADPANIPIYYISKLAREKNVKVLLGGEGSDELFVGYKLWTLSRRFGNIFEGKPWLAKMSSLLHKHSPLADKRKFYFSWYDKVRKGQPVFWSGTELRSEAEKKEILDQGFLKRIGDHSSFDAVSDLFDSFKASPGFDPYAWMTGSDLLYRLPDLLLARLDRMTMAASVEGRNPFLDINVIEYAMRIPPALKYKNKEEKYILKKAFEGILPNEIIYREKDSFSVPMDRLFKNKDYKDTCIEAIGNFNRHSGIFSTEYIEKLKISGSGSELWNISNLALWYEKYK